MKKRWIILLALLTGVGYFVGNLLVSAGVFKSYTPHFEGTTQVIDGPTGVEDLTIDQSSGMAFLSSDDRRNAQKVMGKVYSMQLDGAVSPQEIPIKGLPHDFHPHGLSAFKTKEGRQLLFFINHSKTGHFIDKFEYKNDTLFLMESFEDDLFISPNDLVVVGERQFYFTNDHGSKPSFRRMIEDYLQLKTGYIAYYDGEKAEKVSENICYANGINVSNDGKYLYATSTVGRDLKVYSRNQDGTLQFVFSHDAESGGLDNIEVDKNGILWIGTHLKMLHFMGHAKDAATRSESAVLKVDIQSYKPKIVLQEGVYVNDGNPISGVSVGGFYLNKKQESMILIGSVFEPKVVLAKRK